MKKLASVLNMKRIYSLRDIYLKNPSREASDLPQSLEIAEEGSSQKYLALQYPNKDHPYLFYQSFLW